MSVVTDAGSARPYPGLRSFNRDEVELFFGRDDCIHLLVDTLARTRFLAVLGSSGTGKSSIVKTGLLDALERGLMEKAGARWRIIEFRPGGTPLRSLAEKLLATETVPERKPDDLEINLLRGFLARGPRSIIEWCEDGNLPRKTNLLLLVDQFEELFRYQDYAGKEESEAFATLLLESAHSPEFPIYVTLTMRSEYLGACSLMEGLAETISRGMVLTPRMTREQCRLAIEGPADVCGIKIERPLVNQLLNDLANFAPWDDSGSADQLDRLVRRADQLPLLQYTLNRLWLDARDRGRQIQLRLSDYKAIGGLSGALDTHGNELLEELSKKGLAGKVEKIFRALVQGTTVADAVRRPQRFKDLVELSDGDTHAVEEVLYAFCAPGCNFLAPELRDPGPEKRVPLNGNQWIDISHESLIRQWKKLGEWLQKENLAAQQWRRLKDRMADGEPLRGRELANLIAWREEMKPTEAWAKRHGGGFNDAMAFLEKSQRADNTRRRLVAAAGIGIFAILVATTVAASVLWYRATVAQSALQTANASLKANQSALEAANKELKDNQAALEAANKELKDNQAALEAANKKLKDQQAILEKVNEKLQAETQEYEKLFEKYQVMKSKPATVVSGVDLGPEPDPNQNYANESTDEHVNPTNQLTSKLDGPTPLTIPGALFLTTKQVYDALKRGTIKASSGNDVSFWLIDVGAVTDPTLPNAHRFKDVGGGGKFDDQIQTKLFNDLSGVVKNFSDGLIFFSADANSWASYNAALRAIQMGYPNVYWYRGGLASWTAAGLKTTH